MKRSVVTAALVGAGMLFTSLASAEEITVPQSFGHVTLIKAPIHIVPVDGPSLTQSLEYISQITTPQGHYESGDITFSLNGCWFEYSQKKMCGSETLFTRKQGFDLRELDLRVTELKSGDVLLARADKRVYNLRKSSFGYCYENDNFKPHDEPQVEDRSDSFRITKLAIRDRRRDYSVQLLRTLHHIGRMCGAKEEALLFE